MMLLTAVSRQAGGPLSCCVPLADKAVLTSSDHPSWEYASPLQAAEETVRSLMTKIQGRGCKEDFQPNPSLLQNGQVSYTALALLSSVLMAS